MIWNQTRQLAGIASDFWFGEVGDEVMTWDRGKKKNKTKNKNRNYQEQGLKSFWLPD